LVILGLIEFFYGFPQKILLGVLREMLNSQIRREIFSFFLNVTKKAGSDKGWTGEYSVLGIKGFWPFGAVGVGV